MKLKKHGDASGRTGIIDIVVVHPDFRSRDGGILLGNRVGHGEAIGHARGGLFNQKIN